MKITVCPYQQISRTKNLFIPLFKNQPLTKEEFFSSLPLRVQKSVTAFIKTEFRGDEGDTKMLWRESETPKRIILFGLGEKEKWHERKEALVARRMVQYAKREKITEFATPIHSLELSRLNLTNSRLNLMYQAKPNTNIKNFVVNSLIAQFEYTAYKKLPKEGSIDIKHIQLLIPEKQNNTMEKDIQEGMIIGEEVNRCRFLANTPGSDMTPSLLAHEARRIGREHKISVKILNEKEMKKLGMGGILGVARGSVQKPKFIILEYQRGPRGKKPLVLAGKGVTFDTGGINLKPEQYMYEMHMDMSGGAAVMHGIAAIARLKLPINVIGLIPAVENMPSGSSYRPGDLLKSLSGKTIEVLNTDAEGRIILADALTYALRYKPGLVADIATLTGAAHVALGNYCSALFTNRDSLTQKLIEVGLRSGDYVWPLPLWDEYLSEIKGTFGDIANIAKNDRYGGAIHGAKFLEQFVENTPWAHLDIAPRMTSVEGEYLAKGASGVGVRYSIELAKQYPHLTNQQ